MDEFVKSMHKQFAVMCATDKLFRVNMTGDEIYEKYLSSFPDGTNPVFRDPESSYHNCNNCKNFIRRYGNIVAVGPNGDLITLFGSGGIPHLDGYNVVARVLDDEIKARRIQDVFFETYDTLDRSLNYERTSRGQQTFRLGIAENHKQYTKEEADKFGVVSPGELRTFTHMYLDLPTAFVDKSGKSIDAITGFYRDKYQVFARAMDEISLDTLNLVEDLINQGSLLDGTAHLHTIKDTIRLKSEYNGLSQEKRGNWLWTMSYMLDERTAKFKNTLIGVLCSELTEGKEAEQKAITIEKEGEAEAAKAKWEQEVVKAKTVTKAQADSAVASLEVKTAQLNKQRDILIGEGEGAKKRAIMQANGALEQKLDTWLQAQKYWADALAGYQGSIVPSYISGGANGNAGSNAFQQFMEMSMFKTARDLNLDVNPNTKPEGGGGGRKR